jgi:uncharacterized cofD-like protein
VSRPTRASAAGRSEWRQLRRWLSPGIGLKRWLLVVFVGELFVAVAGFVVLRQFHREVGNETVVEPLVYVLTLSFLPVWLRGLGLLVIGVAIFLYGVRRILDVLLEPFPARDGPLVELVYQKRSLARGPRVVAIGGGTGLSTLLRGLKEHTSNITAIVTVADDGGSSGKLRAELGIAPMGDIRMCIAALADTEPLMTRLMQYRFPDDTPLSPGVGGHAFGNLLIAAMTAIEGDFEEGVRQSNRVLAVRGQVVPVAPSALTLHAELHDGQLLEGQSRITHASGIRRVWVTPDTVPASSEALDAIAAAELIVIGPGSLYTSILPSLLLPEVQAALGRTAAPRILVCNVATQVGETEGYSLADHLAALAAHGVDGLVDIALANDNFAARVPADYPAAPVRLGEVPASGRPPIITRDLVDDRDAHHHDPQKLALALLQLYEDGAGARGPVSVADTA